MKKSYSYKSFVRNSYSLIAYHIQHGTTLNKFSTVMRNLVNSYSDINRNEKYKLYRTCLDLYRKMKHSDDLQKDLERDYNYVEVVRSARRVMRNRDIRKKQKSLKQALSSTDNVFFVCSKHSKPAEDHKDYQGKIYVDRFWRTKLDLTMQKKVEAYIKNHKVLTVQYIIGEPVFMTTRPYCKHYFIPVPTSTVLSSSYRKVVEQTGLHSHKWYTREDYFKLRKSVFNSIENILNE